MKYVSKLSVAGLLLSASFASNAFAGNPAIYEPSLLPSNAQAGQCYARVRIDAQYTSSPETVMVEEGYSTVEVTQPRLSSRTEQIEVKEASVRYEVRQPTFRTVSEQLLVRPSYDKLSVTAPQFKTVQETITTSAPRRVWKLGNPGALAAKGYTIVSTADAGQSGRGYRSTTQYGAAHSGATRCGAGCEIWCLVEEPGESISFNRKVMTSAGDVRRTHMPAKYSTITKQIVADRGGVREIPVPAEYRGYTVEHVVDPGGAHRIDVPAVYGRVNKKTLVAGERYEWRQVVCDPAKGRASSYGSSSYGSHSGGASSSSYSSGHNTSQSYGQAHGQARGQTQGQSQGTSHYSSGTYGTTTSQGSISHNSGTGSSHTYGSTHTTTSTPTGTYYYGTNKPVHPKRH